jgi:glycosyltransferase involved in cell wall biosynthesis
MDEVTIIIKTLDRCDCLINLLDSIFKKYPKIRVLVGDDSEISSKEKILSKFNQYNLQYYNLEKDCGLSAGRNFLLNKIQTKYFVLADDDFVFDQKTNLERAVQILEEKKLDIIGGYIRNYKIVKSNWDKLLVLIQKILKYELPTNYIGTLKMEGNTFYADYTVHSFPEFAETDLVLNFFLAKTERIKEIHGWDPKLKLQEHTEFFYRVKLNNLKVGFTNELSVQHHPVKLKKYSEKRNRNYTNVFMDKYAIDKIVANYDDNRGQVITLRENLEGKN